MSNWDNNKRPRGARGRKPPQPAMQNQGRQMQGGMNQGMQGNMAGRGVSSQAMGMQGAYSAYSAGMTYPANTGQAMMAYPGRQQNAGWDGPMTAMQNLNSAPNNQINSSDNLMAGAWGISKEIYDSSRYRSSMREQEGQYGNRQCSLCNFQARSAKEWMLHVEDITHHVTSTKDVSHSQIGAALTYTSQWQSLCYDYFCVLCNHVLHNAIYDDKAIRDHQNTHKHTTLLNYIQNKERDALANLVATPSGMRNPNMISAATQQMYRSNQLLVQNLHPDVREDSLRDICWEVQSNILNITVHRDQGSGNSALNASLLFDSIEAAEEALKLLDSRQLKGYTVFVQYQNKHGNADSLIKAINVLVNKMASQKQQPPAFNNPQMSQTPAFPSNNLAVLGLDGDVTTSRIRKMFDQFAIVSGVRIIEDPNDKSRIPLNIAYVEFSSPEDADFARSALIRQKSRGHPMEIDFTEILSSTEGKQPADLSSPQKRKPENSNAADNFSKRGRYSNLPTMHQYTLYRWPATPFFAGGFGFSIEAGRNGFTIESVGEESPANFVKLKVGDTLLKVNGRLVANETQTDVFKIIRSDPSKVTLVVVEADFFARGGSLDMDPDNIEYHDCPRSPDAASEGPAGRSPQKSARVNALRSELQERQHANKQMESYKEEINRQKEEEMQRMRLEMEEQHKEKMIELEKAQLETLRLELEREKKEKQRMEEKHIEEMKRLERVEEEETRRKEEDQARRQGGGGDNNAPNRRRSDSAKRQNEEPRQHVKFATFLESSTKLQIPRCAVGKVIGKGGNGIKDLQRTGAIVKVLEGKDRQDEHRICNLFGPLRTRERCMRKIQDIIIESLVFKGFKNAKTIEDIEEFLNTGTVTERFRDPVMQQGAAPGMMNMMNMALQQQQPQKSVIRKCIVHKWPNYPGFGFGVGIGEFGPFIDLLEQNSPAQMARIKQDDRIIEINGVNVERFNRREDEARITQIVLSNPSDVSLLVLDREAEEYLRQMQLRVSDIRDFEIHESALAQPIMPMHNEWDAPPEALQELVTIPNQVSSSGGVQPKLPSILHPIVKEMVVNCLGNNELSHQVNQIIDTTAMTDGQLSALCKIIAQIAELNLGQDEMMNSLFDGVKKIMEQGIGSNAANLQEQLMAEILEQLQPDLRGNFSLKLPIEKKRDFNREYNRDYPRQKDIIEDHTTKNIYFIRFRSREAALRTLLQYGEKHNVGIADPGVKGQNKLKRQLLKEVEEHWCIDLTPNAHGLYSLCMPRDCRGDFNRQAHSKPDIVEEKSTMNYYFVRYPSKDAALDILVKFGKKFQIRPATNKTRDIPGERSTRKPGDKDPFVSRDKRKDGGRPSNKKSSDTRPSRTGSRDNKGSPRTNKPKENGESTPREKKPTAEKRPAEGKLTPTEKRPTGEKIDTQKLINKETKRSLIGAEYVVQEGIDADKNHCSLCNASRALHSTDVVLHLIGRQHRQRYLKKHRPDIIKKMVELKEIGKNQTAAVLDKYALQVQQEDGRKDITHK